MSRELPHSLESEQAVLGSILSDDAAFGAVADVLQASDFYCPENRHVYEACAALVTEGKPLDAVMVQQRLDAKGLLLRAVPRELPFVLQRAVGTTANVGYYAKIVKDLSLVRNMMVVAGRIVQRGYEAGTDIPGFLATAAREVAVAAGEAPLRSEVEVQSHVEAQLRTALAAWRQTRSADALMGVLAACVAAAGASR